MTNAGHARHLLQQSYVGAIYTRRDARTGDELDASHTIGAGIEYPNDIWQVRVDAQEVQQNFDPAVGFVLRRDYRRYRGQVYHGPSRVLGWQSRYRWILTPGNDLYVVYTHNWVDDPLLDRFGTLDRRATSKVLYTHRF